MFILYPLGDSNFYDTYNSVYRSDYQGRPLPEPTSNPMVPVYKFSPKLLKPVALSTFPSSFPYVPANPAAVEKMKEVCDTTVREDACCSTYMIDYEPKPGKNKRLASLPFITNKEYYNPSYDLSTIERQAYWAKIKKIPKELMATSQKPPSVVSRGMSPLMFPDGTMDLRMNDKTTYKEAFVDKKCTACVSNEFKFRLGSQNKLKAVQETEDYLPVPMQPLNQLTIL